MHGASVSVSSFIHASVLLIYKVWFSVYHTLLALRFFLPQGSLSPGEGGGEVFDKDIHFSPE